MGAIGGGIWHGIKGARNSPRGERWVGSMSAIKARAPVLGGNFGVWGGLFSVFDCTVKGYRQKEDPWNAIISGFLTGGSLALRSGPKSALGSAVGCGVLLGVFEGASFFSLMFCANSVSGVGVLMNRMFAQPIPQMQLPEQAPSPASPAIATA
nr:mitochondrial import inner membrane translocase subunit tim-17 [Cryptococcus depauperatus CBS 7855]